MAVEHLLTHCSPKSVNTYEFISYDITQLFKNFVKICLELILAVGISLAF